MTFTDTLTMGILIAVLGWVIKSFIGLTLRRKAIGKALLFDIQSTIGNWDNNIQFLDKLIDNKLKVGFVVPYTSLPQSSKLTLFDTLLSELISHLPDHFPNVSKLYSAFKEADELLAGILRDITSWKEQEHELSEDDIKYLKAKRDRISSYVSIFKKKEISKLSDLPTDYRGIQGTEAIIGTINELTKASNKKSS